MLTYFRGATARHHHFMAVAISLAQATLFSKPSILLHRKAINGFSFSIPFSSSSAQKIQTHKWRQPVVSVLELGGVKVGRDGVMEGVRVFFPGDWETSGMDGTSYAAEDLKKCLEGNVEMRWIDTYFPFTNPSFELEIYFQEKWLEVLGCGVTEQEILQKSGKTGNVARAFGLGLEPLAMVLFGIPDIRLFWSTDERFTSQYPPCYKDMSFWINESFTENNLCEVVRGVAGDLVEEVQLINNFTNKKRMTSQCYRIAYRSMERSLTDSEINELQWNVREQVQSKLKVVLRLDF
ncbi:hypothetical protein PVL29_026292 [Vitis rotundifolia]|uniref:phenylalanine--tRNA ligase n=1 Tax=Vitis rotundifolia TaxID=103349 RepID=A0AA38YM31_VITRO|nr:hypothetical protein PVL29_026292 [Vitis rotundifolia]